MVVLVPKAVDGIEALEKDLTAESLEKHIASMEPTNVRVGLPRFKTTSTFMLGEDLAAMGMPAAFEYGVADFSGIDGTRELSIGFVVHKAFVDVNEAGTEAAAATAVGMEAGSAPEEPLVLTIDRPFLFVIRDDVTGSIVFMGRVADPR